METIDLTKIQSAWAFEQAEGLSDKYAFIPTMEVARAFEAKGWVPVKANEVKPRKKDLQGYQKHLIRFRHRHSEPRLNELHPEIVIRNSHDGKSSFQIMSGFFKLACSNGLIVANSTFNNIKIRHHGYRDQDVYEAIEHVSDRMPEMVERVKMLQEIRMSNTDLRIMAEASLIMRYGLSEFEEDRFSIPDLLRPVRKSDSAPTLWNSYNVIQEKFLKGGRFMRQKKGSRLRKSREVKSVEENVRLNQGLWHIAERMAEAKNAT